MSKNQRDSSAGTHNPVGTHNLSTQEQDPRAQKQGGFARSEAFSGVNGKNNNAVDVDSGLSLGPDDASKTAVNNNSSDNDLYDKPKTNRDILKAKGFKFPESFSPQFLEKMLESHNGINEIRIEEENIYEAVDEILTVDDQAIYDSVPRDVDSLFINEILPQKGFKFPDNYTKNNIKDFFVKVVEKVNDLPEKNQSEIDALNELIDSFNEKHPNDIVSQADGVYDFPRKKAATTEGQDGKGSGGSHYEEVYNVPEVRGGTLPSDRPAGGVSGNSNNEEYDVPRSGPEQRDGANANVNDNGGYEEVGRKPPALPERLYTRGTLLSQGFEFPLSFSPDTLKKINEFIKSSSLNSNENQGNSSSLYGDQISDLKEKDFVFPERLTDQQLKKLFSHIKDVVLKTDAQTAAQTEDGYEDVKNLVVNIDELRSLKSMAEILSQQNEDDFEIVSENDLQDLQKGISDYEYEKENPYDRPKSVPMRTNNGSGVTNNSSGVNDEERVESIYEIARPSNGPKFKELTHQSREELGFDEDLYERAAGVLSEDDENHASGEKNTAEIPPMPLPSTNSNSNSSENIDLLEAFGQAHAGAVDKAKNIIATGNGVNPTGDQPANEAGSAQNRVGALPPQRGGNFFGRLFANRNRNAAQRPNTNAAQRPNTTAQTENGGITQLEFSDVGNSTTASPNASQSSSRYGSTTSLNSFDSGTLENTIGFTLAGSKGLKGSTTVDEIEVVANNSDAEQLTKGLEESSDERPPMPLPSQQRSSAESSRPQSPQSNYVSQQNQQSSQSSDQPIPLRRSNRVTKFFDRLRSAARRILPSLRRNNRVSTDVNDSVPTSMAEVDGSANTVPMTTNLAFGLVDSTAQNDAESNSKTVSGSDSMTSLEERQVDSVANQRANSAAQKFANRERVIGGRGFLSGSRRGGSYNLASDRNKAGVQFDTNNNDWRIKSNKYHGFYDTVKINPAFNLGGETSTDPTQNTASQSQWVSRRGTVVTNVAGQQGRRALRARQNTGPQASGGFAERVGGGITSSRSQPLPPLPTANAAQNRGQQGRRALQAHVDAPTTASQTSGSHVASVTQSRGAGGRSV